MCYLFYYTTAVSTDIIPNWVWCEINFSDLCNICSLQTKFMISKESFTSVSCRSLSYSMDQNKSSR